jgi:hypothetical protein
MKSHNSSALSILAVDMLRDLKTRIISSFKEDPHFSIKKDTVHHQFPGFPGKIDRFHVLHHQGIASVSLAFILSLDAGVFHFKVFNGHAPERYYSGEKFSVYDTISNDPYLFDFQESVIMGESWQRSQIPQHTADHMKLNKAIRAISRKAGVLRETLLKESRQE